MRLACDVGGTFTDLALEDGTAPLRVYKASTTPTDPVDGLLDAVGLAAADLDLTPAELLARVDSFIHATTRGINAVLTGATARTALLVTAGHRDILLLREGGRADPYDNTVPFPQPYVARSLTFEVPERVGADGKVVRPVDEDAVLAITDTLRDRCVESVAVCLLWSIANPAHELAVGEILARHLPDVPVTLSHRLNPSLREYRRASSAAIDASLKPLMSSYLNALDARLRRAGFGGRLLAVTNQGGVIDVEAAAAAPIHTLNSGPSLAPVAGRHCATLTAAAAGIDAADVIVGDTGGTSYDVSLVRGGRIPWTRETWIGSRFRGHMTGFPSVDVKNVGAGGGSIAWLDGGGMLHVGPQSAGAVPGPACYGAGGTEPTVTDCVLVLGYMDPDDFLGGSMRLYPERAREAVARTAEPMGLAVEPAAAAVLAVATESMVAAVSEITVNQGMDPSEAVLVGGGGAAGLTAVAMARRLGCRRLLIPETGAALSAVGALLSELSSDAAQVCFTLSDDFAFDAVNDVLAALQGECRAFADGPGNGAKETQIEFAVEARYPHQAWEIEVPLRSARFADADDVRQLVADFHAMHRRIFAVDDPHSAVELLTWRARVRCRLHEITGEAAPPVEAAPATHRRIYLPGEGWTDASVRRFAALAPDEPLAGPAIVQSPYTTVVLPPDATAIRSPGGLLVTV